MTSTAYDALRLAGRCANGFEGDAGSLFHAVPKGKTGGDRLVGIRTVSALVAAPQASAR